MFVVVTRLHSTKTKQETVANVAFPVGAPMASTSLPSFVFHSNQINYWNSFFFLLFMLLLLLCWPVAIGANSYIAHLHTP